VQGSLSIIMQNARSESDATKGACRAPERHIARNSV
jgi:hypothetical protein